MTHTEKATLTKNRIFESAIQLFNQNGYAQTTISAICQAADVAKGTFYIYYDSKESIIKASYYNNLATFMTTEFTAFETNHPQATNAEKITQFVTLELAFAEKMGVEITTLAYTFNLKESLTKPNSHFEKRQFTQPLRQLLSQVSLTEQPDDVFIHLESLVRGLMATWCFSGGHFALTDKGNHMLQDTVNRFITDN